MKTEVGSQTSSSLNIGILALQGAFDLHSEMLSKVSAELKIENINVVLVKKPSHLENIDGIILPGGESTVISKLLVSSGLNEPLKSALENGLPAFGTCAGLIILNNHYNFFDCVVDRNAYGTQIDSFEAEVDFLPTGEVCRAFFIRAPKIQKVGETSNELAMHENEVVGVVKGNTMGITCHPEVAGTTVFHRFFVENILRRVSSLDA